jgi:hypothetical protein
MKKQQMELPFQNLNVWREIEPRRQTKILSGIARLIKQIFEMDAREGHHEIATRSENL